MVLVVVSAPLLLEATCQVFYEGEAAPEHTLLRYEAVRSVTNLAKAPFKPGCWFWLGVLVLQRIVLGIIQAIVFLTATSRALWGVIVCCVFFGLQTTFHPFKNAMDNAAQTMLLFCATVVSALNVVPAAMSTNAKSTSDTMEHEVKSLVIMEAALLRNNNNNNNNNDKERAAVMSVYM